MGKQKLLRQLQKNWQQYWKVELFNDGWIRQQCKACSKFFWAKQKQDFCNDSNCIGYKFLEADFSSIKKISYEETWDKIKSFFVRHKHKALKSYPVVCRWFPGLYFTIASIVAFQRKTNGKTVFSFPANPLIIPQFSLRFNDIDKVGFSGRHATTFIMVGQHSLYDGKQGYWKDKAIELDYKLLTQIFKIKPEVITFVEDAWLGEGAFGYSLEYFVYGLELGNCVFTEFLGSPENYRVMPEKVIDMGAGLGRFTWSIDKTLTQYDCVYAEELKFLNAYHEFDKELMSKFVKEISLIDLDKISMQENIKQVLNKFKINENTYRKKILPRISAYVLCDHLRTLILAFSDWAIPSNVGGGYNLRTILRRLLNYKANLNEFDLYKLVEKEIKLLKHFKPIPKETPQFFAEIFEREKEKFIEGKEKAEFIAKKLIEKKQKAKEKVIRADELVLLYQSYGIYPETIEEVAETYGIRLELEKFREKMEELKKRVKVKEKAEWQEKIENLVEEGKIKETKEIYYIDQDLTQARAKILASFKINKQVGLILDSTIFYPEGGGQIADKGFINGIKVVDVQKYKGVIIHFLKDAENTNFKCGEKVRLEVDKEIRKQIRQHHTSVHLINWAARKVLGNHIWQAGSVVNEDKATLDVTHWEKPTPAQLEEIEVLANKAVRARLPINFEWLKRVKAERKYGFRIYQGGAIPKEILRIVNIGSREIEACGGLHLTNTYQAELIRLINVEKISDGVIRFTLKAGKKARLEKDTFENLVNEIEQIIGIEKSYLINAVELVFGRWKKLRKALRKRKLPFELEKWGKFIEKELKQGKLNQNEINDKFIIERLLEFLGIQKEYLLDNIKKFVKEHDEFIEKLKNEIKTSTNL